jgi:hypothetical protein
LNILRVQVMFAACAPKSVTMCGSGRVWPGVNIAP